MYAPNHHPLLAASLVHCCSSGSISEGLVVKQKENLAAHPLVLGPHYQPKDIRVAWAHHLQKDVSGEFQDIFRTGDTVIH